MTDKLKIPIQIGDTVAAAYSGYADILVGTVIGFTPKMVKIDRGRGWTKNVYPNTLVVITQQQAYNRETYPEAYV